MPHTAQETQRSARPARRFMLKVDAWLIGGGVIVGLLAACYIFRWPSAEALGNLTVDYLDLIFCILTLIALVTRKGLAKAGTERTFWGFTIAAYVILTSLRLISLIAGDLLNTVSGDLGYFAIFLCLLLALESRNIPPGSSSYLTIRYWLNVSSGVMYILGILVYFIIIPSIFDIQEYESMRPSFYFYFSIDLFLVLRFAATALMMRAPRWQCTLYLFGLAMLFLTLADAFEFLTIRENLALGSAGDLMWILPYLPIILATRLVDVGPFQEVDGLALRKAPFSDRMFIFTVFALPIIHVLGYTTDSLDAKDHPLRSIFILVWFALMITLIAVQYSLLHKRNRVLENLRLRNVRILEAISRVQSLFIAASDSPSVFETMLEHLLSLTESEYGFVGEIIENPEEKPYLKTLAMAYIRGSGDKRSFFGQRGGHEIHDLDTLFAAAVKTGKPVISNDPATYPRRGGFPGGTPEPFSYLGIPLYHREQLIGMFGIANSSQGYSDELLKFLEPFSTTCAGIISAYHNERERKLMSELATRFGRILDDSLQEIYIFDANSLHFMQVNRGARGNIGYEMDELRELTPEDLYPETGARFRHLLQPLLDGTQAKVQYTTTHRRKDNTTYPVDVYLQRASFDERPVMVAIVLDITERRLMEKEKARLESQIIQSQKLETIGTLAGGIAHDFNNILAPIIWYTEMITNDPNNDEEIREDLRHVLKAANRAKDLVQQILTFGRLSDIERSPVQIQLVIEEAIKLLRASLPATIEIQRMVDNRCEPVLADPTQIHQVVMNLCTNAYHAMRQRGGVLKLGLSMVKLDGTRMDMQPQIGPGTYVCLSVTDTGHGMDPSTMDRIFEPFFTTKRVGEGTGLGLSVIHGIVMTHGGAISVQSKPGQGSTFTVFMPPINYEAESAEPAEHQMEGGAERILFVDDEEEIARTGKLMLERLGYTVTATTSSIEALEIFEKRPDQFDLVITDQTMPQLTGLRLAAELKRIRPDIPIVLATGFSEDAAEERWRESGVDFFVMKPVVGKDLYKIIRTALSAPPINP